MLPKLFAADSVLRHSSWPQCLDRTWQPWSEVNPALTPLRHQIYLRGKSGFRVSFRRGRTQKKKNLRASTAHGRHNKYSSSLTFRSLCNNQLFIYNFLKVESSNWYFVSQSRTLSDFVTVARREQWKDKIGRSSGACFLTVFEDHV